MDVLYSIHTKFCGKSSEGRPDRSNGPAVEAVNVTCIINSKLNNNYDTLRRRIPNDDKNFTTV